MYPAQDAESRLRIDNFLKCWDSVVDSYYTYLCASSESSAKSGQEEFSESLVKLEEQLSGDGHFCLGKTFSIAECIAAPWVQRFFVTLPYFRGVDFSQDVLPARCKKVARWMSAVRERPSVIASACPEDEMLEAAKKYYVSFVSPGAPGVL
mmetsp:Transcript_26595/g.37455  ORF Transcript_26595/g.37455 Transcript_26595/m.37455 type:complete len:151 (+) Transcript_26595:389-841(+)